MADTVCKTLAEHRKLAAACAVAVAAVGAYRLLRRSERPGQEIPYAKGRLPFVGHLREVLRYGKDCKKIAIGRLAIDAKEKDGHDVFRVSAMGREMVVVTDPDLAEEVLKGDPHRFTKNFNGLGGSAKLMLQLFGDSGLFFVSTEDPRWGITHNILKAPFSIKGMRELLPLMTEQADRLVEALRREVGVGGVAYIDRWVTKMAFETIAVCGLGTAFGSFDDGKDHPFIATLNAMMRGMLPFSLCPSFLWPLLLRRQKRQLMADAAFVRGTCSDVIKQRRAGSTHSSGTKRDLLDLMLHERDPKSGQGMDETMIVDNVLTFLFAGQDSTAAAMASCLCFLCAHPACKERLLREIDEVVGDGPLQWEQLAELRYLDCCVKETLRLVPPAAAVARGAQGDQLLAGKWRVRDGDFVILAIMAFQYDRSLWGEDAQLFRPERWEEHPEPPHKFAFMPFASGPRACTGREFTLVEQKVTMVKLLQHFDFKRPAEVKAEEGYNTVRKADMVQPPFVGMDVEFKDTSAFVGLFSAFELLERKCEV